MNPGNPDCFLRTGLSPEEKASLTGWSIDPRTNHAFRNLRLQAEDLALELVVRLRVLEKSLVAGCSGGRGSSATYRKIRLQLESFLGSLVDQGFAEQHYFPVIRHYIQSCLPSDLSGCAGTPCRIKQVETAISLLSEDIYETGGLPAEPAMAF